MRLGICRLAWNYVPSEENNKVFGRAQSFVPGSAADWYLQLMVKDSNCRANKYLSAVRGSLTTRRRSPIRGFSRKSRRPRRV